MKKLSNNCAATRGKPGTWLLGMLMILALAGTGTAEATAPRISAGMFGEEKKADILQYRLAEFSTAVDPEQKLLASIVDKAFKAGGMSPVLDVQPARQLAKYALFKGEVAALIGRTQDFNAKEKKRYRFLTFYLSGGVPSGSEIALVISNIHPAANDLYFAFESGMRQLLASGQYLEMLEAHHGRGSIPATYLDLIKSHHPGWK